MRKEAIIRNLGAALTLALFAVCLLGPRSWAVPSATTTARAQDTAMALSPQDLATFSTRFQNEIWPLLANKESNCIGCHTATNPSQLHFGANPDAVFKALLADGHLDAENPASLLARLTSPIQATRMPPAPFKPWTDAQVAVLRAFVNDLYAKRQRGGPHPDELFPASLLTPYTGKQAAGGMDNTFLTYYQLRGKIKAIFDDDWERDGKDLWEENLAQFGGADFERSFNENSKPTAQFLSGLDALGQDVASRAYVAGSGPFAGRPADLPSPLALAAPDAAYRREIGRLYRAMLFRDPTPQETLASFRFLQNVYRAQPEIAARGYDLRFELTARDEQGLTATENVNVRVDSGVRSLRQSLVDENTETGGEPGAHIARCKLEGPFTFKAADTEQRVVVSNANTRGNVIVHALDISGPLPNGPTRIIPVTDPSVQPQGAWRLTHQNGVDCYEDENRAKGSSNLVFPLTVKTDGQYDLTLEWRNGESVGKGRKAFHGPNADNVLVEVTSYDKSRVVVPVAAPVPPKGEARFTLDQSDDSVMFRDLEIPFRFGPGDGVEISNEGTRGRVVADAVKFIPMTRPGLIPASVTSGTFLVAAKDAEGQAAWKDYRKGQFVFYRPVGPRVVSDENDSALKGKLSLLYRPSSRSADWKPEGCYHVAIGYPAEIVNDTSVPIIVHAQTSAPILRVAAPPHAHVGAELTLDAGGSYNVQHTPLQLTWRQVGGAAVHLSDPHAARLTFVAPALSPQQAAWEGLCRALIKHPDFLFTRPLSLAATHDPQTRRRLQLVKIAQDLVGRPPSSEDLRKLDRGASLASLIDAYLDSPEAKAFYFRRIRLYLESHGTAEDDEPARLWTYIAFTGRPFKEILTADYTVDTDWQKQPRPAYCGKSGVLTMKGFIKGKPGLPHFNYAAQVCEKFLGYVFEVPAEIVKMRDGITAASTTSANSVCYSCHKMLTPLAYQRGQWTDNGDYKPTDDEGHTIDASDHQLVPSYPFKGNGLQAFSLQAQNKERFIRTMIQTHFVFYFGREMRYDRDERGLYKRLWDTERANNYNIKGLIRAILTSPEYLNSRPEDVSRHLARR